MKNIILSALMAAAALAVAGCDAKMDNIYSGKEYIMFSDTLSICPVLEDGNTFAVPVVATTVADYDRTVAVTVVDSKSNAHERRHYSIDNNTVTIKAGELRADVMVRGNYDEMEADDSLAFTLELIMPGELESPLYGKTTRVQLKKCCPFNLEAFTGYCVLTSTYLQEFSPTGSINRLLWTRKDPKHDNRIICHDWLYDDYDITLEFDPEDPLSPKVVMESGQVISDELSAFGIIRGDNRILVDKSSLYPAVFYPCEDYLSVGIRVYVNDLDQLYGEVGHFYNIMEWVSDEEAKRIMLEDGLTCHTDPDKEGLR